MEQLEEKKVEEKKVEVKRVEYCTGNDPLTVDDEALLTSVKNKEQSEVKRLLDEGVCPNIKDQYGLIPLNIAISDEEIEIVRELYKHSKKPANPNLKDFYGFTALYWAIHIENRGIVELLLEGGEIDVNLKNTEGKTPLHMAVEKGKGEIVGLLLGKEGIDVNLKDKEGKTPIDVAINGRKLQIAEALYKKGAELKEGDLQAYSLAFRFQMSFGLGGFKLSPEETKEVQAMLDWVREICKEKGYTGC